MKKNTKSSITLPPTELALVNSLAKKLKAKSKVDVIRKGLALLQATTDRQELRAAFAKASAMTRDALAHEISDLDHLANEGRHDGEVAQVRAELVTLACGLDLRPELDGFLVLRHALEEAARAGADQRELLVLLHAAEFFHAVATVEEFLLPLRVDECLLLARPAGGAVGNRFVCHASLTPSSGRCGGPRCGRCCGRGAFRA